MLTSTLLAFSLWTFFCKSFSTLSRWIMIWIRREWLSQNKRPHCLNIKDGDIFSLFTWLCLSKWYIIYLWKCAVLFSLNWTRSIRYNEKSSSVFSCKWDKISFIFTIPALLKKTQFFSIQKPKVQLWGLKSPSLLRVCLALHRALHLNASWLVQHHHNYLQGLLTSLPCLPWRSCFHCLFCGRLANVHLGCTVTWLCGTGQFTLILFRARRQRVDTWPSGWCSCDATCCVLPSVWLKLTGWW